MGSTQPGSGRWTSPRLTANGSASKDPPNKVTTLDHIISQSQSKGKDTFCGQTARSSHDGELARMCSDGRLLAVFLASVVLLMF
jgi:hypothetical protein